MSVGEANPPARRRRPWSEADDAELARLIKARWRPGQIAKQLQRTIDAVRGRASHLGFILPSAIRPWREPVPRIPGKAAYPVELSDPGTTEEDAG